MEGCSRPFVSLKSQFKSLHLSRAVSGILRGCSDLWTALLVCKLLCCHLHFREDLGRNQVLPSRLVSPNHLHMVRKTLISMCVTHEPGGHLQHEFHLQICSNLQQIDPACSIKTMEYRAGEGLPAMLNSVVQLPSTVIFKAPKP